MSRRVDTRRSYHHGNLREVVIPAAVDEVQTVGVAAVSMRRIAQRAGVSHAALAYQFGDKTGIFTAIAIEGFRRATQSIGTAAAGDLGFVPGGMAYVQFALAHPGHFEVMFRPYLYRMGDPDLREARDAAFDILYTTARVSIEHLEGRAATDDEVSGLVMAGWSLAHGFATLMLTSNLSDRIGTDPAAVTSQLLEGTIALGQLVGKS